MKKHILKWATLVANTSGAFGRVGAVSAVENVRDYLYSDVHPLDNGSYYRIKGVTDNGEIFYSSVIEFRNVWSAKSVHLFSAAGSNELTINASLAKPAIMDLAIYNTQGALLYRNKLLVQNGSTTVILNLLNTKNLELFAVLYSPDGDKFVQKIIY